MPTRRSTGCSCRRRCRSTWTRSGSCARSPGEGRRRLDAEERGPLHLGRNGHVGATPLGVMRLLAEYRVPPAGARAVVVGRSAIVGKPVALLLLQANATVTVCHSRTDDLARHTLDADILVAAVGSAGLITADMVKAGATVDRRRDHAHRRGSRRRRRPGRGRGRRVPHSRSREASDR